MEGSCDICGKRDEVLATGPEKFGVCHEHKRKWFVGSNSHISQYTTHEERRIFLASKLKIAGYQEIDFVRRHSYGMPI